MAGKPVSGLGSGGMITKIEAAKIALAAGCNMVIASGHGAASLAPHRRRARPAPGSWPARPRLQSRKRWIAGTLVPMGRLHHRCRARRCALGKRQEPAAGGRQAHRGQLCARRCGEYCERGRRSRSPAGSSPMTRPMRARIAGPQDERDRKGLGLQGARRDGASRRSGDDGSARYERARTASRDTRQALLAIGTRRARRPRACLRSPQATQKNAALGRNGRRNPRTTPS